MDMTRTGNLALVVATLAGLALPARAADPACVGWIAVDSGDESGASILLDGKKVEPVTPATLKDVLCGRHTVEVVKPFFKSGKVRMNVKAGDVARVHVELKSNFGGLKVASVPDGAEVTLDGKDVGRTPLKLPRVEVGSHTVVARLPDHSRVERRVKVKPGKEAALKVKLAPDFGQIEISVRPATDALVWLDGDPLGNAPMTLKRVVAGKHKVRITSELYKAFETRINVRRGKIARVKALLKPNHGTVTIRTRPQGGRLRVDGKEAGRAPVTLKLVPGVHEVWAAGEGPARGLAKTKIKVKLGGRHKLVLKLPVKTGSLMIDTVPFAAKIEIDGKKRGKAPLSLKAMPVGTHVLLARAKGLPPLAGRIDVVEGRRSVVEMNIKDPVKSVYRAPKAAPAPAEPEPEETEPEKAEPEKVAKAGPADAGPSGSETEPVEEIDTEVTARAAAPVSIQRISAWAVGGTAVAAAITSGVLFGLGFAKQMDADDAHDAWLDDRTPEKMKAYEDLDDESAKLKNIGWAMVGVAAAAGAVSVVLFMTEPEPEVDATGPAEGFHISPMPGGAWIGYQARF